MLPLGMILGFAGYGVGTWGFILVKGYNITLKQWFSPFSPYTGPLSKAGQIPATQVFPGKGTGAGSSAGSAPLSPVQQQQQKNLKGAAPNPHGTVQ